MAKRVEATAFKSPVEDEEVLCPVLESLPLLDFFQMRGVCKLWRSLLTSRKLCEAWSARHDAGGAGGAWFVMVRLKRPGRPADMMGYGNKDRELVAFDTASHRWVRFRAFVSTTCSEAALALLGGPSLTLVLDSLINTGRFKAVGSEDGSGLVCFMCRRQGRYPAHEVETSFSLVMLNPVTGAHTILPPPPNVDVWADFFWVNIDLQALPGHHYRVFMTASVSCACPGDVVIYGSRSGSWKEGPGDCCGDVVIYDSRSGSWKEGKSCCFETGAKIGSAKELDRADLVRFSDRIVFAYNVELDEWHQLYGYGKVHLPEFNQWCPRGRKLFRHKGRVLLAAAQLQSRCLTGFAVWELHPRANISPHATRFDEVADWVEVARTPPNIWKGLHGVDHGFITLHTHTVNMVSSGGLICMTVYHGVSSDAPLVYDLDRQVWYHLPPHKGCPDVAALFSMRPSLAAAVA